MVVKNKNIILYGGAGWLGSQIVSRLYEKNDITVFSRDESKHIKLKSKYPKVNCVIGDVNDLNTVLEYNNNYDISINLAALKIISSCQVYPRQSVNTIINGAFNTKLAAIQGNVKHACLISSDKACAPSGNVYGPCKSIAESIYINNNTWNGPSFSVCRYGNVEGSISSILCQLPIYIKENRTIKLFHEEMTRFTISADQAIDLILGSLDLRGCIVIPVLKSYRVKDLFNIYTKRFGLKYEIGEPRIGEKLHESLYSLEESRSILTKGLHPTNDNLSIFILRPNTFYNNIEFINTEFSSKDHTMSYEELDGYLGKFNYFMS